MTVETVGGERPYVIEVQGEEVTVQDTMVAGFTYRIQLESQLGSSARVVQCFKAWNRLQREGAANLQGSELEHAAAWLEAHRQARWQARRFFLVPSAKTFVLRLRGACYT